MAWIRFPHLSNSQDCQPWLLDSGVNVKWVHHPKELEGAKVIVLPGSKNTLADLEWLRSSGLAEAIIAANRRGIPVVGICGGYQMLGERVCDPQGVAGDSGVMPGLNLLPIETTFATTKEVTQVSASWDSDRWMAYEIHMGVTGKVAPCDPLLRVTANGVSQREEGCRKGRVWGTYLHGLFESPALRRELATEAAFSGYNSSGSSWREHLQGVYDGMADLLEAHLNMEELWRYVES